MNNVRIVFKEGKSKEILCDHVSVKGGVSKIVGGSMDGCVFYDVICADTVEENVMVQGRLF